MLMYSYRYARQVIVLGVSLIAMAAGCAPSQNPPLHHSRNSFDGAPVQPVHGSPTSAGSHDSELVVATPSGFCLIPRPSSSCKANFLGDITFLYGSPETGTAAFELGLLVNDALGNGWGGTLGLFGTAIDEPDTDELDGAGAVLKLRYRRWLSTRASVDLAFGGTYGDLGLGLTAQVSAGINDFAVVVQHDSYQSDGQRQALLSFGLRLSIPMAVKMFFAVLGGRS
jgi:hypothetical protein